MANVLEAMGDCGFSIDIVSPEEFDQRFEEALADEENSITVSSILSYNGNADEKRVPVKTDSEFTVKALYRLGFSWPITGLPYIDQMFRLLQEMDFFD